MLIDKMGFQNCTHEPCLYYKINQHENITLILRQVDNFLVAHKDEPECDQIGELIQSKITFPLNTLGHVQKFNGVR